MIRNATICDAYDAQGMRSQAGAASGGGAVRAAAHFIVDVALLKTKNDAALHESIMGTYFGTDARVERDLPCDLRRVPRPSTADATLYKAHVQDAALLGLEGRLARPSKAPSFRRETSIISRYRRGVFTKLERAGVAAMASS